MNGKTTGLALIFSALTILVAGALSLAHAQVATWDEVDGCWKRLGQCIEQPDK